MPRLAVLGSDRAPFTVQIDRHDICVGRSRDADVVLSTPSVSRRHARLWATPAGWRVADLGSLHGTELNGRSVVEAQALEAGDRIGVGDVVLVFEPPPEEVVRRRTAEPRRPAGARLVGGGPSMSAMRALIDRFAPADVTVLVLGETGVGKEIVARRLHEASSRACEPFVVVNCPALPAGLVEAELFGTEKGVATGVEPRHGLVETAEGGTLFLDEIGDLDTAAQAKLLRFLQDRTVQRVGARAPKPVDVRVVAATHHDLRALVAQGRFRQDLLHRLEVATIEVPPLRRRLEDVPELVEHFLALHARRPLEVSEEAMALLSAHDYPGNVRELEHALQRAILVADGELIEPADLPRSIREGSADGSGGIAAGVDALCAELRERPGSFWELVRGPFLRRELSRDQARTIVARLHRAAGGSTRRMAAELGLADEYRKLVDFLRNAGLRPDDPD